MDAAGDKTMKSSSLLEKIISKSSAKTSNMTGSSAAMFLVERTLTLAHWHPKFPIK